MEFKKILIILVLVLVATMLVKEYNEPKTILINPGVHIIDTPKQTIEEPIMTPVPEQEKTTSVTEQPKEEETTEEKVEEQVKIVIEQIKTESYIDFMGSQNYTIAFQSNSSNTCYTANLTGYTLLDYLNSSTGTPLNLTPTSYNVSGEVWPTNPWGVPPHYGDTVCSEVYTVNING